MQKIIHGQFRLDENRRGLEIARQHAPTMGILFRGLIGGMALVGAVIVSGAEKTAEAAWASLVGEMGARAGFEFVENQAGLPNVLIYGDSISIGYTPGVRKALRGRANVYRIHLNGGSSDSFVDKMDAMETTMRAPELSGRWDFDWDIIHVNVGLHDMKYINALGVNSMNGLDLEKGELVTSVQDYMINLRRILTYLQSGSPRAKLIFALTTKVPPGAQGRFEESELSYNAAALTVLADYPEIEINDLRTFSLPYEQPGNVHFKPDGIAAQAAHVAGVIAGQLPQ